jgi:hypothetical protein
MQSVSHDDREQRGRKEGVWRSRRILRYFIVLVVVALVELSGCQTQASVPTAACSDNVARPLRLPATPPAVRFSRFGRREGHFL